MCFVHFVWCSVVERRVQPLLVIVAGIVCNGITRLTEAIVVATPDLFFLDGADHALNVGVVIRSIVSSVLSLDTVLEELNEVFRTGLSTILAP